MDKPEVGDWIGGSTSTAAWEALSDESGMCVAVMDKVVVEPVLVRVVVAPGIRAVFRSGSSLDAEILIESRRILRLAGSADPSVGMAYRQKAAAPFLVGAEERDRFVPAESLSGVGATAAHPMSRAAMSVLQAVSSSGFEPELWKVLAA